MPSQDAQPGSAVTPGMWAKPVPAQPPTMDVAGAPVEVGALVESMEPSPPSSRAGRSAWAEYALSIGWDEETLAPLTKAEIRRLVGED